MFQGRERALSVYPLARYRPTKRLALLLEGVDRLLVSGPILVRPRTPGGVQHGMCHLTQLYVRSCPSDPWRPFAVVYDAVDTGIQLICTRS